MTPIEHIARFFEEGGDLMYVALAIGLLTHLLLVRDRAWRGSYSNAPLRRRLLVSTLGAFACLSLALVGYVCSVVMVVGGTADATPGLIYKGLAEAFNLVYLCIALALAPTVVMLRALLFELRDQEGDGPR